jgi:hypothetical protein
LKLSCHSWGLDSDALKGILWDSYWVIFGLTCWDSAELRSGWFSGLTLGQSCRMSYSGAARQTKAGQIWKNKDQWGAKIQSWWSIRLQIVVRIIYPSTLRLHWRRLISSC